MSDDSTASISLRALNEFCFCPRLFYLMYVDKEFESNPDVDKGKVAHDKAEKRKDNIRIAEETSPWDSPPHSLSFAEENLMLNGRLDAIKLKNGEWVPVEAKKSCAPSELIQQIWNGYILSPGAWYNDQLQVIGQMYLLRENGYDCSYAEIYYRGSRTHARVDWTDEAFVALKAMVGMINDARNAERPRPLRHSEKCIRCSLNNICMPDETNTLNASGVKSESARSIIPARYDKGIVYVCGYDKRIAVSDDCIRISSLEGEMQEIPLLEVMMVSIMGTAQITTQCMHALLERNIRVMFSSNTGWLYGIASPFGDKNLEARRKQLISFPDIELARREVSAKIFNQKLLLRRKKSVISAEILDKMQSLSEKAIEAKDRDSLLGVEGKAAQIYFDSLKHLLNPEIEFDCNGRSRRPPRDPVNALLSYSYALLLKDMVNAIVSVGLEPSVGFFHAFIKGRPALALDIMESYRPIIADSVVIRLINTQMVRVEDFEMTKGGVNMKPVAKRKLIMEYERRMGTLIAHPQFSYPMTYRRMLEVEVRLLLRYLEGEIKMWKPFRGR